MARTSASIAESLRAFPIACSTTSVMLGGPERGVLGSASANADTMKSRIASARSADPEFEKDVRPILAKACQPEAQPPLPPENRGPLENHYQAIQDEVRKLLQTLKVPA